MGASPHWTYASVEPADSLGQGDILRRTVELNRLIESVHGYFSDKKYRGFLVTTQSCDLVPRGNSCKASHVSVASIRTLDDVISDYLSQYCGCELPNVYMQEKRRLVEQFLERLLNQNEQAMGLFYLHPTVESGIHEHSVAMLRVTISFKAEHYDLLKSARCGRLSPEFSSKLGWLKGNLYSRVATQDWKESPERIAQYKQLVEGILNEPGTNPSKFWVPERCLKEARKAQVDFTGKAPHECFEEILRHTPKSPKDKAIERVRIQAQSLFGSQALKIEELAKKLAGDAMFEASCKKPVD